MCRERVNFQFYEAKSVRAANDLSRQQCEPRSEERAGQQLDLPPPTKVFPRRRTTERGKVKGTGKAKGKNSSNSQAQNDEKSEGGKGSIKSSATVSVWWS